MLRVGNGPPALLPRFLELPHGRKLVGILRGQAELTALPADQRSALLLFAYDEMSHIEIAEALGRSAAAVNALIYRARLAVRKALEEDR